MLMTINDLDHVIESCSISDHPTGFKIILKGVVSEPYLLPQLDARTEIGDNEFAVDVTWVEYSKLEDVWETTLELDSVCPQLKQLIRSYHG